MSAPPAVVLSDVAVVSGGRAGERTLSIAGGRLAEAVPAGIPLHRLRLPGHLVFPGLVNAHDHLQLNAVPRPSGIGTQPNSYAWIEAFRPRLDDPDVRAARAIPSAVRAWHGGLKNLLSGVTLVAHHDPWEAAFDDPSFPVGVLAPFGWCHSPGLAGRYGPLLAESFRATPPGVPWFVHLAEGTDGVAAGELGTLEAAGALAPNTVLVHGVGLTPRDVGRVVEAGAGVVWCPTSNLFMLGATLDPRPLARAGTLALATDSRLTGSPDLLEELRAAAAASGLSPATLVDLVTTAAARRLRVPQAGGLEPGQRADLLVLRDPGSDPPAALVNARRADLRAVVRCGLPAVADPDLASWFEACGEEATAVTLDGRPKLVASRLLGTGEAALLEPGLVLGGGPDPGAPRSR